MAKRGNIPVPDNFTPEQQDRIKKIIQQLRECYRTEPELFDFRCSQYISGDHNKRVRREIMRQVNGGTVLAIEKCGLYAVANELKAYFQQAKLFDV